MKIKKVIIDNFKSIDHLELDFDKVGDSYTKIFVGINESGKSNILEALSYFKVPENNFSFEHYCNQKFFDRDNCEISFHFELDNPNLKADNIPDEEGNVHSIDFSVSNIVKKVTLNKNKEKFEAKYNYDINLDQENIYIIKKNINSYPYHIKKRFVSSEKKNGYVLLTSKNFISFFGDDITDSIKKSELDVTVWKPTQEYFLTDINLKNFATDINSNKPLRNIFILSGYKDQDSIVEVIRKIHNPKSRSILKSKLEDSINEYINKAWNNKINIVIEISEAGTLAFLIKDQGIENKHDRYEITDRSQGAQQFLSLVLSLSLEAESHERKNELIIIDEPEVHLHPSGIRDLGKELLKVGRENYVIMATHSPFIIDKNHKERHYIVKKNNKAITEVTRIKETDNIIDEEVLNEAFGINVYRDLLNPHSVLVEGSSDKILLKKAFNLLNRSNIGITNGHGSNIDTLASRMNFDGFSVLVVTDDDKDGQKYKERILKIGGTYNPNNVFTIRDLEGTIVSEGTIEDTLGVAYVQLKFKELYTEHFAAAPLGFNLVEGSPFLSQIITFLKKEGNYNDWFTDELKKKLSDDFNPRKNAFSKNFPMLKSLAEKIIERLK